MYTRAVSQPATLSRANVIARLGARRVPDDGSQPRDPAWPRQERKLTAAIAAVVVVAAAAGLKVLPIGDLHSKTLAMSQPYSVRDAIVA